MLLYWVAMIVLPTGASVLGLLRWTPNASLMVPSIIFVMDGSSISVNDRISTKNAISKVAMSANVAIQAGAPASQAGHSLAFFFLGSSGSSGSASTASSVGCSTTSSTGSCAPSMFGSSFSSAINNDLDSSITRTTFGGGVVGNGLTVR